MKGKVPAGAAALAVSDSVDFPLAPGVNCELTPGGKLDVLSVTFGAGPEGAETVSTNRRRSAFGQVDRCRWNQDRKISSRLWIEDDVENWMKLNNVRRCTMLIVCEIKKPDPGDLHVCCLK